VYTCECGYTVTEEIVATGHDWELDYIENPTHFYEGYTQYRCNCGEYMSEPIEKLAEHEWDEGEITTYPSHLEDGIKTYYCACGESYTETVPKVDDAHTWENGTVTVPATHTQKGVMTYTCECGETLTEEISCTYDHEWDEGVVTLEPTHFEVGVITFSCACGETYTEEAQKLEEHEFGEWYDVSDHEHERACPCGESERSEHVFDGEKDADCNECPYTREIAVETTSEQTAEKIETVPEENENNKIDQDDATSSGCGSSLGGASVAIASIIVGLCCIVRKKKDE
jgi:hypothetical protein